MVHDRRAGRQRPGQSSRPKVAPPQGRAGVFEGANMKNTTSMETGQPPWMTSASETQADRPLTASDTCADGSLAQFTSPPQRLSNPAAGTRLDYLFAEAQRSALE